MARDTRAKALLAWFNGSVARYFSDFGAFDREGVFLLDGTYFFVPDNPRYKRSSRLRFDEHGHPLGKKEYDALTPARRDKTGWRRCYRAVFLLHLDRTRKLRERRLLHPLPPPSRILTRTTRSPTQDRHRPAPAGARQDGPGPKSAILADRQGSRCLFTV